MNTEVVWVATWGTMGPNGDGSGGPSITTVPSLGAIAGFHASECSDCNSALAGYLNTLLGLLRSATRDLEAARE